MPRRAATSSRLLRRRIGIGRPLRVMFVVPELDIGGAERHVATLLPALDPARFRSEVIVIGEPGRLFDEVVASGVAAHALRRTKKGLLLACAQIGVRMMRFRPDIVVTWGYNAEILGRIAAVLTRVPRSIVWEHSNGEIEPRGRVRRMADQLLDPVTSAYFAVAKGQLPYLVDELGRPAGKVRVIYNGVDPDHYRCGTPAGRDPVLAAELGIGPGDRVIGIVAALRHEKDHATLLRATRIVLDRVPEGKLLVVGDGQEMSALVRLTAELGITDRVVFAGPRRDVADVLRVVDVFCLSSYTIECFPMALLEAMACGLPAVCTDVGGIPEMIVEGVTGHLVPARDPDALAAALVRLLRDPDEAHRMGRAARARLEVEFSLDRSVRAAEDAFLEAAGINAQRAVPVSESASAPLTQRQRATAADDAGTVDVCIVSYGRPAVLAECLAALRVHLPGHQVRVWDNRSGSTPAIREIAAGFPEVDWTFSEDSRGYAAGVNALVDRCPPGRDLLLLNPDAVLTGPLVRTRTKLHSPRVAAASPTVLDPTSRQERWDSARRHVNLVRSIVNRSGYADRLRGTPFSTLYPAPPDEVDGYIAGVCLFVSRAAWDDVGPFDERYFLYGEDVDWQRRALARGWRLAMIDEPEVRTGAASVASSISAAGQRAKDTLAANTALLTGGGRNWGRWTVVTGTELVMERVQRSRRRQRREAAELSGSSSLHPVVITTNTLDWGESQQQRIAVANELVARGHAVTMVCLQALGPMQRHLDDRVRLVLRPWWQPVLDVAGEEVVVSTGTTRPEIAFAALWRALGGRRRRRWAVIDRDGSGSMPGWIRSDRVLEPSPEASPAQLVDELERAMADALGHRA